MSQKNLLHTPYDPKVERNQFRTTKVRYCFRFFYFEKPDASRIERREGEGGLLLTGTIRTSLRRRRKAAKNNTQKKPTPSLSARRQPNRHRDELDNHPREQRKTGALPHQHCVPHSQGQKKQGRYHAPIPRHPIPPPTSHPVPSRPIPFNRIPSHPVHPMPFNHIPSHLTLLS